MFDRLFINVRKRRIPVDVSFSLARSGVGNKPMPVFSQMNMIGVQKKPVFQSKKISQVLAPKEKKPPIVNNQCVVYKFQCDLCDTDYVGYTARHLHQRIGEHKYSAIGRHLEDHGLSKSDLKDKQFSILRKCRTKFDFLIFEMLFIRDLSHNSQSICK